MASVGVTVGVANSGGTGAKGWRVECYYEDVGGTGLLLNQKHSLIGTLSCVPRLERVTI